MIMDARMLGQIDIIVVGIILIAMIGRMCDRLLFALHAPLFQERRRTNMMRRRR